MSTTFSTYTTYFQNVHETRLLLIIIHSKNKRCIEFTVKHVNTEQPAKKIIVILFTIIFNLFMVYYDTSGLCLFMFIIIMLVIALHYVLIVTKEKLLLVKALGLQYTTTYWTGFERTQFIPWEAVKKVFINEAVSRQKVLYYLTIMVKDKEGKPNLVTAFQYSEPRLMCLKMIYQYMAELFRT